MKFQVVLGSTEKGEYTVFLPSLPGCISEGEDVANMLSKIQEAIELYIELIEADQLRMVTKLKNLSIDQKQQVFNFIEDLEAQPFIFDEDSLQKSILFPITTVNQVAGCLSYSGPPKSLDDFESAIFSGIQEQWNDRS